MSKKGAIERRSAYKDSRGRVRSFPDLKIDGLFNEMDDCRLQFQRLLKRADKWTDRVESLRSKQKYLKRGFTQLDLAVKSMKEEASVVDRKCETLEGQLADNFIIGSPNTEDEWRSLLERGVLIETAVGMLSKMEEEQCKEFYYSDNGTATTCSRTNCDNEETASEATSSRSSGARTRTLSRAETETMSAYITFSTGGWTSVADLTTVADLTSDEDEELNGYLRMATVNCQIELSDMSDQTETDTGFQSEASREDALSS